MAPNDMCVPYYTGDVPTGATAVEIDALFDGTDLFVAAVAESLDSYGGCGQPWPDSGFVQPPATLGTEAVARLRADGLVLARRTGERGPLRLRLAWHNGTSTPVSVLPAAGPGLRCAAVFAGFPYVRAAAAVAAGVSLARLRAEGMLPAAGPSDEDLPVTVRIGGGADCVTGTADTVGEAYALARAAAGDPLPDRGRVLVSLHGRELREALLPLRRLVELGFHLLAEPDHAVAMRRNGIDCNGIDRAGIDQAGPVVLEARTAAGTAAAVQGIDATRR